MPRLPYNFHPTNNDDPIERLLTAFLAGRGPHTTDAYLRDLDAFCAFVRRYGMTPRQTVGSARIDRDALEWFFQRAPGQANEIALHYTNELLTRQKATATIARHISALKTIVKYARMTGMVTWAIEVTTPRIERTRDTRGPSLETIQGMLKAATEQRSPIAERDAALLRLAFDLALRCQELIRLDVADVDLKTRGLWIFGKGRRAKERLTMPEPSCDAVKAWLAVRGTKPGPLLLSYSHYNLRGRLVTRAVYRIVRDLGAAVGVQVWPHGLRHTSITQAIDLAAKNGMSIDLVRQFSRHRALATLMTYRDLHESARTQETFARLVSEQLKTTQIGS